jgi:hypothetical protein
MLTDFCRYRLALHHVNCLLAPEGARLLQPRDGLDIPRAAKWASVDGFSDLNI